MARRAVAMLLRLDKLQAGRVLVVEPESAALGNALRTLGFCGERWALLHEQHPLIPPLHSGMESAFERRDVRSWPSTISRDDHILAAEYGQFEVVVALNPVRLVAEQALPELLAWLRALVAPRGFLIVRDSAAHLQLAAPIGIQEGLLPVADELWDDPSEGPREVDAEAADDRAAAVAVWQSRGAEESRQTGILRRVALDEIEARAMVRHGVITTYREVFGGDEWCEWVRCSAPGCGRQYSRREAEALETADRCVCGQSGSLRPYHLPESVLAEMRHDLSKPASSACYVRAHPERGVDAFVWGYVTRLSQLARDLIPKEQAGYQAARQAFAERVRQLVPAGPGARSGRIYYQAQIGALEEVRSFGLLRGLFHRALQFAADHGTGIVVTRTSPRTSVYPLLVGIGMQIVYRYDEALASAPSGATATRDVVGAAPGGEPGATNATNATNAKGTTGTADASAVDASAGRRGVPRVVLAGALDAMLRLFYTESDRRVIVQIAHQLRQQPGAIQAAQQRRQRH